MPFSIGMIISTKPTFSLTLDFGARTTTFDYTGEVPPTDHKLHAAFMNMRIDILLQSSCATRYLVLTHCWHLAAVTLEVCRKMTLHPEETWVRLKERKLAS